MRLACFIALALLASCEAPPETHEGQASPTVGAKETFNQRIARQRREIPGTSKATLPAPEGNASEIAQAALAHSGSKCSQVTEAERFESDGTIIAKCGDRDFRIFKIEGTAETMPLDCTVARDTFGIDPCDKAAAATREDDSIGRILNHLTG